MLKKSILGLLLFSLSFSSYSITEKEAIERDLSKVGVKKSLIKETQELYDNFIEISPILDFEEKNAAKKVFISKIKKLIKKDEKNFKAVDYLLSGFPTQLSVEEEAYYLDLLSKYCPYENEVIMTKLALADLSKNVELSKKYTQEMQEKFPEHLDFFHFQIYKNLGNSNNELIEKVNLILEQEEKNPNSVYTEEELYNVRLLTYLSLFDKKIQEGKNQEAIDYYLTEIVNHRASENAIRANQGMIQEIFMIVYLFNMSSIQGEQREKNREKLEALNLLN